MSVWLAGARACHGATATEADVKHGKIDTAYVLDMKDERIRSLIPARKPILTWAHFPMRGKVRWHPHRPRQITINGESFIVEERFPPTKTMQAKGPDGKVWTYEYFEDKHGGRIYPTCHRDYAIRTWWVRVAEALAKVYAQKRDEAPAHKSAVIIQRFAEVYRGYPIYGIPSWRKPWQFFDTKPYPYVSGKWDRWYPFDMKESLKLAAAYELIAPSGAFDRLGRELGRDVRREIEEDFLIDHCKLMMEYDSWHNSVAIRTFNHQPTKCLGMINVGRALKRPVFVHYAYQNLKDIFDWRFTVDGVFPESPSYHWLTVNRMKDCIGRLKGYCDPPGYVDKLTGKHFDDFDPAVEFPILPRALAFLEACRYPGGRWMMVHETNPSRGKPREKTTSRLFPGFGHGILGRGQGAAQIEAHLHFSKRFNHAHDDTLNIILWACGEELVSEVGYNSESYRGWSTSALSHNLVVVDGSTQCGSPWDGMHEPDKAIGGQIVSWFPQQDGFGVVKAESRNCYPQCSAYRRGLMMVEVDATRTFVVDVFEVAGGRQHDWLAHGSCDKDQTLTFDKPSSPYADSLAADGKTRIPMTSIEERTKGLSVQRDDWQKVSQYWGNIRHVRRVAGPGPWVGTFAGKAKGDARLRLHLLAPTDCTLYVGGSPSMVRAYGRVADVEKYMMPIMTARRRGDDLRTRYVAVWEPYRRSPWLRDVKLTASTDDGVAVSVRTATDEFTVFWGATQRSTVETPAMKFTGRYGCVRQHGDRATLHLCEASRCGIGGREVSATPQQTLDILSASADPGGEYLLVKGAPEQPYVPGQWAILLHPQGSTRAVRLGRAVRMGGNAKLYCPDGLGIKGDSSDQVWKETCFPLLTYRGPMQIKLLKRIDSMNAKTDGAARRRRKQ